MKMHKEIQHFVDSDVVQKAFRTLSDRAILEIFIEGERFCIKKVGKRMELVETKIAANFNSDMVMWIPKHSAEDILRATKDKKFTIGQVGVLVFEKVFTNDASQKIKFRISASLFTLLRKGYFSVLIAGGPEIMKFLARHGFGSLSKIKTVLSQNRSSKN